jgi:hypothetical protein
MACGGPVNAHGMAEGGEVESDEYAMGDEPVNDDGESSQMIQADDDNEKARRAFVRAVKGGR